MVILERGGYFVPLFRKGLKTYLPSYGWGNSALTGSYNPPRSKNYKLHLFSFFVRYNVNVVLFNPGDHPGETPLCYGQEANYELMREDAMKRFSKFPKVLKHFEAYKRKYVDAFPDQPPLKKLDSPELYKQFDKILIDVKPKKFYINSPRKTRIFFGLLNLLPRNWSDKARLALMRLPK